MATGVVNPSPPSTAEFKNEWICTCAPPVGLHVVDREYIILEDSNSVMLRRVDL